MKTFPKDFFWGGAVSAFQCEGAFSEGGRKDITIDHLSVGSRKEPRNFTEEIDPNYYYPTHKGNDFYHRYEEDIALLAKMGIKMFRFSINWARIFPNGDDSEPNQEGIDFYHKVFDELHKYHIEPLVTIYHFEMPYNLAVKYDGWYSRKTIDFYLGFCEIVFNEYKEKVKYWLPFNEMNSSLFTGTAFMVCGMYTAKSKDLGLGVFDPNAFKAAVAEDSARQYQCVHHMLIANAKAVKLGHEINPDFIIGCMISGICKYPLTCNPDDVMLSTISRQNNFYYCPDIMIRGYYPHYAKRLLEEVGIELKMEDEDVEVLKNGTVDFFSFSYYSTACVSADNNGEKTLGNLTFGVANPYLKTSDWGWQIDPVGLRYFLNEIYDRYQLPIMVVENGLGQQDCIENDKTVHDPYRIEYFREHIKAMNEAINIDGVNLIAYTPWGIIDLPSASTGEMSKRYGVIYVDADDYGRGTYNRYPKDSFYWYKKVIASNGENGD